MIPEHTYFLPKSGEHDITLTLFTADLWEPWKIPLAKVCKIDVGRGMQGLVAISYFVFLDMGIKEEGGRFAPPPIGARVKLMDIHQ